MGPLFTSGIRGCVRAYGRIAISSLLVLASGCVHDLTFLDARFTGDAADAFFVDARDRRDAADTATTSARLDPLRVESACGSMIDAVDCYVAGEAAMATGMLSGAVTGETYALTLRIRGVVEPNTYAGGSNDGGAFQIGGTPSDTGYNQYRLTVSSPAATYYLNRGPALLRYCIAVDYTAQIRMDANATLTLAASPVDSQQHMNRGSDGMPLVVNGLAPSPSPFNGQFVQVEMASISRFGSDGGVGLDAGQSIPDAGPTPLPDADTSARVDALLPPADTRDGGPAEASVPFISGWDPRLGTGSLDRAAGALLVDGSTVVVGGSFRRVRGVSANLLARFDPMTSALAPIANTLGGPSPSVNTIARWQGALVVGGAFTGGIASEVPTGFALIGGGLITPGFVFDLVPDATTLWVGGNFITSDHSAANVASRSASGWAPLSEDPGSIVLAMARDAGSLWVGGDFVSAVGVPFMDLYAIGRYDLFARRWTTIGGGATEGHGSFGRASVSMILPTTDFVYAGGDFGRMDGRVVNNIARWRRSTSTWEAVPPGQGVSGAVAAMAYDGRRLYVAGLFSRAGGVTAANVAVFDTTTETWSALPDGGIDGVLESFPPQVLAVAVSGNDVYFAGDFANAGGLPSPGFAHYRAP